MFIWKEPLWDSTLYSLVTHVMFYLCYLINAWLITEARKSTSCDSKKRGGVIYFSLQLLPGIDTSQGDFLREVLLPLPCARLIVLRVFGSSGESGKPPSVKNSGIERSSNKLRLLHSVSLERIRGLGGLCRMRVWCSFTCRTVCWPICQAWNVCLSCMLTALQRSTQGFLLCMQSARPWMFHEICYDTFNIQGCTYTDFTVAH